MRHRVQRFSLSRFSSLRKATIKALARAVLLHQRIITTEKKAKALRPTIEQLISLGKKGDLAARRRAYDILGDHHLVKVLFDELAPLFSKRQSGFTRIIFWKKRGGDNAQLVILELTEQKKTEAKKKVKEVRKPTEEPKQEPQPSEEKPVKEEKKKFFKGLRSFLKREKES
jgi:large subunit ribosomal protein L17